MKTVKTKSTANNSPQLRHVVADRTVALSGRVPLLLSHQGTSWDGKLAIPLLEFNQLVSDGKNTAQLRIRNSLLNLKKRDKFKVLGNPNDPPLELLLRNSSWNTF